MGLSECPGQSGDGGPDRPQVRGRPARRDRADCHAGGAGGGGGHPGHSGGLQRHHRPGGGAAGQVDGALGHQRDRRVRPAGGRAAGGVHPARGARGQTGRRDLQPRRGQLGDGQAPDAGGARAPGHVAGRGRCAPERGCGAGCPAAGGQGGCHLHQQRQQRHLCLRGGDQGGQQREDSADLRRPLQRAARCHGGHGHRLLHDGTPDRPDGAAGAARRKAG